MHVLSGRIVVEKKQGVLQCNIKMLWGKCP